LPFLCIHGHAIPPAALAAAQFENLACWKRPRLFSAVTVPPCPMSGASLRHERRNVLQLHKI
jgi:hypothetical protein